MILEGPRQNRYDLATQVGESVGWAAVTGTFLATKAGDPVARERAYVVMGASEVSAGRMRGTCGGGVWADCETCR